MEYLEEIARMLTLEIGTKNKGFTLIELIVVIFIMGIASSYIVLNSSIFYSIEKSDKSLESDLMFISEESIFLGSPILWHASLDQNKFYIIKNGLKHERKDLSERLSFSQLYSDNVTVIINTGDGNKYQLNDEITSFPLITFYPSGENSGARIEIRSKQLLTEINMKQNGEVFSAYE